MTQTALAHEKRAMRRNKHKAPVASPTTCRLSDSSTRSIKSIARSTSTWRRFRTPREMLTDQSTAAASSASISDTQPSGAVMASPGTKAVIDASTRCRYKTGRCLNARVVKPNGTLLLLCEFHRNQQNRTKKRSDMKYRHDRAKKRLYEKQLQRRTLQLPSPLAVPTSDITNHLQSVLSKQESYKKTILTLHQYRYTGSPITTPSSTPNMLRSLISPAKVQAPKVLLNTTSRSISIPHKPIVLASPPSAKQSPPSPVSHVMISEPIDTPQSTGVCQLSLDQPSLAVAAPPSPMTTSIGVNFPLQLSPVATTPGKWGHDGSWHPEDVQLLEYFIL